MTAKFRDTELPDIIYQSVLENAKIYLHSYIFCKANLITFQINSEELFSVSKHGKVTQIEEGLDEIVIPVIKTLIQLVETSDLWA